MIELFRCDALDARITLRQCRINQEEASRRAQGIVLHGHKGYVGRLHVCLACTQKDSPELIFEPADLGGKPVRKRPGNMPENIPAKYAPEYSGKRKKNMTEIMTDSGSGESSNQVEKINTAAAPVRYCKNHPDRPAMVRKNNPIPMSICRECYVAALAKGRGKPKGEESQQVAIPGARLLLDFAGREELLAKIVEVAADEERTPAGQIMFWIRRFLQDGK